MPDTPADRALPSFADKLRSAGLETTSRRIETLQINITRLCNQACRHCHVDASPKRTEMMDDRTIEACLGVLRRHADIKTLDITGGAPELHPHFRSIVEAARSAGKHVMVRHNLTVQSDPHPWTGASLADLPEFFATHGCEVVSSLPYWQDYFTDRQRGHGVFEKSIAALRRLNEVGYGCGRRELILDLVYNPVGAFLPPDQATLEADYRRELGYRFGVRFDRLFAITNMPIHRFKDDLVRIGTFDAYMDKLRSAFNAVAATNVMCRDLISVSWDGRLHDCDFNQMLDLGVVAPTKTIFDFDRATLEGRTLNLGDHCFGCTAGAGSSCGGTTT